MIRFDVFIISMMVTFGLCLTIWAVTRNWLEQKRQRRVMNAYLQKLVDVFEKQTFVITKMADKDKEDGNDNKSPSL